MFGLFLSISFKCTFYEEQSMSADLSKTRREFFGDGLTVLGTLALASCSSSWYGSRLVRGVGGDVNDILGRIVSPFLLYDGNPSSATFGDYIGPQQYADRVVLLMFGASWSAPSLEQLCELKKVEEENDSSIKIMAVNGSFNGDWRMTDVSRYSFPVLDRRGKTTSSVYVRDEWGYTWYAKGEIADDLGPAFAQSVFGVKTFPTTFVIDEHQRVREVYESLLSAESLNSIVAKYNL